MAYFATHVVVARYALRDLIFAFLLAGAIPAALAMLMGDGLGELSTDSCTSASGGLGLIR